MTTFTDRTLPPWPEEEQQRPELRDETPQPRRQYRTRQIAVVRDIGPHVALYYLLGAGLGLAGLSLLCMLHVIIGLVASLF